MANDTPVTQEYLTTLYNNGLYFYNWYCYYYHYYWWCYYYNNCRYYSAPVAVDGTAAPSPPSDSHCESDESSETDEGYEETWDGQSPPIHNTREEKQNVENCSSKLPRPPSSSPLPASRSMSPAQQQKAVNQDAVKTYEDAYKLRTNPVLARKQSKAKLNRLRTLRKKNTSRPFTFFSCFKYFKNQNNPLLKYPTILRRNPKSASRERDSSLSGENDTDLNCSEKIPSKEFAFKAPASKASRSCNHPRCETCKHMNDDISVKSKESEYEHQLPSRYSCTTSNVVYMIECSHCGKQYIGETELQINRRINRHRYDIANKRGTAVANHFNQPKHNFNETKLYILEKGFGTPEERILRESDFIRQFNTLKPAGINRVLRGSSTTPQAW